MLDGRNTTDFLILNFLTHSLIHFLLLIVYYPQRAQRAGGISKGLVISWLWLSLTTLVIAWDKMCGKITKFLGNLKPQYLWTETS